jgi:uncharacterized NAD-dependent epimerase/dehydratase family protein
MLKSLTPPYLLFLGDARDMLAAKTATGLADWRPQHCVGQLRLPGCQADLGLPDLTIADAVARGVRTVVIGVANRGGVINAEWIPVLEEALNAGLHLAAGLHQRLSDIPVLREAARAKGCRIDDVRWHDGHLTPGSGEKRSGKRLLAVGTDCSIGKMYTTLALEKEMQARGRKATFQATGQTGIMIAGQGIAVDAVVADFISGAAELIAPANDPDHWDVIEGQGSLFHPSFAGVSLGLLHGSQPDALVMCHEPTRTTMRGVNYPLPSLEACIELNLQAARLTNPAVRLVGFSINTSALPEADAHTYLHTVQARFDLPAVDPLRTGVGALVDSLDRLCGA